MSEYNINPLNVTIKEVSLGNKKLTKSIFNQIEPESCFDENIDFIGENIIGYVKDKNDRFLLWIKSGKLRKSKLTDYYKLRISTEYVSLDETTWFLRKTKTKFTESDDFRDKLSEGLDDESRYIDMVKKAQDFLNTLVDKQVYI
jgi:hypothetical protein